jgi:electron transfer flavoprotein beta subunit
VRVLVAVGAASECGDGESDASALEAGLVLRAQSAAGEVIVVSVGGARSEEVLRECIARGADRAVRVWDDCLADADADVLVVARALAAVAEREQPDLVLCGAGSANGRDAVSGVAVAGFAGLPRVAAVRRVEAEPSGDALVVERELESGWGEVLRVRFPALLTVQAGANHPRRASFRALAHAREKPIELHTLADLELDADAVVSLAGSRSLGVPAPAPAPGPGRRVEMLAGSTDDVAAQIIEIVRERLTA